MPTTGYGKWFLRGSTYVIEKKARHLSAYIFSMWFIMAEGRRGRGTNSRTGKGRENKRKTELHPVGNTVIKVSL